MIKFSQMKRFLEKNWLVLLIIFLYFLIRLPNLEKLPIFNDESIYLHWSQIVAKKHRFFYPTEFDGKQPLVIWLFAFFRFFPRNLLLSGRLISVLVGLGTTLGVFFVGKRLFDKKIAFLTSLFYILVPYVFFFERLALMEAALNLVAIWSFYLTLVLLEKPRLKLILLLGFVLGVGMWVKFSAIIFIVLVYLSFSATYFLKKLERRYLLVLLYSAIITFIIFTPLFFHPSYHQVVQRDIRFKLSLTEVLSFPFDIWTSSFKAYFPWLFFYSTPFLFLLGFLGLRKSLLSFWFGLSLLAALIFSRNSYSRYIVLAIPFFVLLAGQTLEFLKKRKIVFLISIVLIIFPCLFYDLLLLKKPEKFFDYFPKNKAILADKWQYITGWPSGYGIQPAMDYLIEISEREKIQVGIRRGSGNPEDAIYVYLLENPNIKFFHYPLSQSLVDRFTSLEFTCQSFIVTRDNQFEGLEDYLEEIDRFFKPEKENYIGLYRLKRIK